jgi:hypothetical protein
MSRPMKIASLLTEADRSAFDEFLRVGAPTIDRCVEWLGDRGYDLSRKAAWTYKRNFDEVLKGIRASAEMARYFTAITREGSNASDIPEAALGRFNQLMMEKLFQMEAEGELDSGELMKLSIALKGAVATKQQIEEIKADAAKRQKEAVDAAEKVAKSGGGGAAVVAAIKRAMGFGEEIQNSEGREGGGGCLTSLRARLLRFLRRTRSSG